MQLVWFYTSIYGALNKLSYRQSVIKSSKMSFQPSKLKYQP